jgi:AbrB family looped-hinge helix DNA binding protein
MLGVEQTFPLFDNRRKRVALVKVKEKYQVTLPAAVRAKTGVAVGDFLEAKVQGKRITLTPKVVVDRAFIEKRLAQGLKDIREGRVLGPFKTAKAAIRALRARTR